MVGDERDWPLVVDIEDTRLAASMDLGCTHSTSVEVDLKADTSFLDRFARIPVHFGPGEAAD